MYGRGNKVAAYVELLRGWLGHIDYVFENKAKSVPPENEPALAASGARFTLFFAGVHRIGLDKVSVLNHQTHVSAQAVIKITTLECVFVRCNRHIHEFPIPQPYYAEEIH